MKALLIAALLTGVYFTPAFATDTLNDSQKSVPSFEQTKSSILKQIDENPAPDQAVKNCVQAAQTYEVLKACRAKYSPTKQDGMKNDRQDKREQPM